MVTPCNPSAPPVSQPNLFANSRSKSATPSVTISRVRSEPRNTRKLVTKPSAIAARPETTNARTGSLMISYLASSAAV